MRATSRPSSRKARLSIYGERLIQLAPGSEEQPRKLFADCDQIIIVNGSQQGLDLCARLLLDPGDRFAMEDPGHLMARHVFSATGAAAVPIPVDIDRLETEQLAKSQARLAYVTPPHRERHLSWTVSNKLSPTPRIGYLLVPSEIQSLFATAKQIMDRHTPLVEQEALATMFETGAYDGHVNRVRRRNGERRQILLDALRRRCGDRIQIDGAAAGLHVVVWFRDLTQTSEPALIKAARVKGVGIYPVAPLFDQTSSGPPVPAGQYRARHGLRRAGNRARSSAAVSFWLKPSISFVRGDCHSRMPLQLDEQNQR
ncbi:MULTISPECIES: aminotransferase class I/II-fold pyridoxal phosphate-dependent enzyme [unclassified Bradyrhizobium]